MTGKIYAQSMEETKLRGGNNGKMVKKQEVIVMGFFLVYYIVSARGVWELKREGGLLPILSPTKLTVRQNSFLSAFLSARLCARLPVFQPFYLPWGLSCLPIFFLFPSFPSFFLEIYSPTPFTVRRQGGLLDPPDPPCQTPLIVITIVIVIVINSNNNNNIPRVGH